MVKVNFYYQDKNITKVEVLGHANFDEIGKDIVCAGISAIVIGVLNALDNLTKQTEVNISQNQIKGQIIITVLKVTSNNQMILKTMLWQLKTISDRYHKNIIIKEVY